MGFYDGRGTSVEGSTFEVAHSTETPVLLVMNARGMAASLAAVAKGFMEYQSENRIAGILLNGVGAHFYRPLKTMLEDVSGLEVLGHLPQLQGCSLESRHLGLVAASEVADLDVRIARLGEEAERNFDIERILEVASAASPLPPEPPLLSGIHRNPGRFRLAVGRDEAFCFYYHDALDLLEEAGAELVFFSPLGDARLPEDIGGLYLGGGYPELHAARLAGNRSMLDSIRRQVEGGLPTFAECGGFMALCRSLRTEEGTFEMSGILENDVFMTSRLVRFGYVDLNAERPSVLCPPGWKGRGHEFHYSESTDDGTGFVVSKPDGRIWNGIHTRLPGLEHPTLHVGYPHLHLCGDPSLAVNFAQACRDYLEDKNTFRPRP